MELSFTFTRETSLGVSFTDCIRLEAPVPLSAKRAAELEAEAEAEMDRRVAAYESVVATPSVVVDPVAELTSVVEQLGVLQDRRDSLVSVVVADEELSARADENPVIAAVIDEVQTQVQSEVVVSVEG